ncbi:DUF1697 domain-containing protein [Pseudorhodobacter sp. W20_MBD10_FR17]|uniref:DUF1697 domain-containing protein n=1 Tax=Pseudorhodobacter sp. W20_MBD10_FR17 TaxID=3240266 RepID=UPI003F9B9BAD
MAKFIALLRAVNVGGTGMLPMSDLRRMASEIGFLDVQTYIQSGNLIFTPPDLAPDPAAAKTALESRLQTHAGAPVCVILRTAAEMVAVLRANPFKGADPSKVGVLFLNSAPPPDTASTAKGQTEEEIALSTAEIFIHYPSGMGRSKLRLPAMAQGTTRNLNTTATLAQMAADAPRPT